MDQSIDWFTPFIVRAREGHKRRAGRQRHRLRCRLRVSHGPTNSTARMGRPLASRAYTGDETQESNGLCNFNPVWMSFGSFILSVHSFCRRCYVALPRRTDGSGSQTIEAASACDRRHTYPAPSIRPFQPRIPIPNSTNTTARLALSFRIDLYKYLAQLAGLDQLTPPSRGLTQKGRGSEQPVVCGFQSRTHSGKSLPFPPNARAPPL